MDFLNQAYAQLADLFRSMTAAARITAGLLLAVVVISLVYLIRFQTAGSGEYLLGGRAFSEGELSRMEAAFSKAKLTEWDRRDNQVRVPHGRKAEYMAALLEGDAMPAHFGSYFNKLSENESPFTSRQQREMNFKAARERELSLIFSEVEGIETATVQYDEMDKGGLHPSKEKTAVVAVRPEGDRKLDENRVRSIRNFMAAAIIGLERSDVSVLDLRTGISHTETSIDELPAAGNNILIENQAKFESFYREKILNQLAMIDGVVVGVNVTLDPKLQHDTSELTYGPQPHSLEATGFTKETITTSPGSGGRVGAAPNGVGNTGASVSPPSTQLSESTDSESREAQKNILDQTTITSRSAPLIPQHVTASICVPSSHYAKIWRERNPAPEGQTPAKPDAAELQKIETEVQQRIEESIVQMLPNASQGKNPTPLVKVTTYPDMAAPRAPGPDVAQKALTWLGANWKTIGMIFTGLFSLLMLRGMTRSTSYSPPPAELSLGPRLAVAGVEEDEAAAAQTAAEPVLKRRSRSTGPSLREELTEMVKEDPDAAANILRSWIGNAA